MIKKYNKIILFIFFLNLLCPVSLGSQDKVLLVEIDGTITSASDDMFENALNIAQNEQYQAVIMTLNTPGGAVDPTIHMTEMIANSTVPVIGYVYPENTKAWSAGTLLLISTDLAAMAPYTVIGSAQPVTVGPSGSEYINDSKIINALVARSTENARQHGRNESAAAKFITENLNLNPENAKKYNVIEYVANNVEDLLQQVNGKEIKGKILNTSGAEVVVYQPPLRITLMNIISDPTISSLLLLIGVYAVIFGLSHPGVGAEIFGLISISLGVVGMGFDVSIAAIFLIVLGVILIVLEFYSPGFGAFGVAGLACIIAGSILLAPTEYPQNYLPADYQRTIILSILSPTILIGIFLLFVLYKVGSLRRTRPKFGELIGDMAVAIESFGPDTIGYVRHQSEKWQAKCDVAIKKGDKVRILDKDGIYLIVSKID